MKKSESYDNFYKENKGRVFAYLLRMTGDYHLSFDIMQESFTRYFARYHCNGNHRSLLYTIARNAVLDSARKRREEQLQKGADVSPMADPESQLIEKQEFDGMIAAIQKLKPIDRELISLLADKTLSYKEIGKLINISESNVKVKIHRARIRLKEILRTANEIS